jgi:linoleoyl-CoA desaturase
MRVTFTNQSNQFTQTLRSRVEAYFKENKIKQSGSKRLFTKAIFLFSVLITLYTLLVFYTLPIWVSVLLCMLLGTVFAAIGFNVMHDGAHGSFSSKKWVNNLMSYSLDMLGGSSIMWKIKHNHNHHTFTNIEGMDDDIDIVPYFRLNENQPKKNYHKFQHIYWVALYCTTYILWVFMMDYKKYFTNKIGLTTFRKLTTNEHIMFWSGKTFYLIVFFIIPFFFVGIVKTLVGYLIASSFCGLLIALIFQLAHIVEGIQFPRADENGKIDNDWTIHQLQTTANFATKNKLVSWFVGGLNYQVEHHLFPKISHIHYPKINAIVKETCAQFNVTYHEYPTVLKAVKSHVSYLKMAATI